MANSNMETAEAKNRAVKEVGFITPDTFEKLSEALTSLFLEVPRPERDPPVISVNYKRAQELGPVCKPVTYSLLSPMKRGQDLLYAYLQHVQGRD
ncbi:ATP citrate lyase subunit 1 [Leucoagaricus gongylophorus]